MCSRCMACSVLSADSEVHTCMCHKKKYIYIYIHVYVMYINTNVHVHMQIFEDYRETRVLPKYYSRNIMLRQLAFACTSVYVICIYIYFFLMGTAALYRVCSTGLRKT